MFFVLISDGRALATFVPVVLRVFTKHLGTSSADLCELSDKAIFIAMPVAVLGVVLQEGCPPAGGSII